MKDFDPLKNLILEGRMDRYKVVMSKRHAWQINLEYR